MNVTCFIADTLADALAQMRARFGQEGVVVGIRYLNSSSVTQLWKPNPVELTACASHKEAQALRPTLERGIHAASAAGRNLRKEDLTPSVTSQVPSAVEGLLAQISALHQQLESGVDSQAPE